MKPEKDGIVDLFKEGTCIDRAVRLAARDALLRHKREGRPVVVWRDGKVVWLSPDEIVIDADDA